MDWSCGWRVFDGCHVEMVLHHQRTDWCHCCRGDLHRPSVYAHWSERCTSCGRRPNNLRTSKELFLLKDCRDRHRRPITLSRWCSPLHPGHHLGRCHISVGLCSCPDTTCDRSYLVSRVSRLRVLHVTWQETRKFLPTTNGYGAVSVVGNEKH